MALRLSGFYIWLGVLSLQPHKEERFMYPAYPLLGLNAAVSLFLLRGLVEKGFEKWKQSSYQVSASSLSRLISYRPVARDLMLMHHHLPCIS
jgi:alpha-1,2-mannosyltransferase